MDLPISRDILALRREYSTDEMHADDLDPSPILQFEKWLRQAITAQIYEPNAMALATATRAGAPSVRMVLLKSFDERGFVFYTNYGSQKGRELAENAYAALCLYWPELHRQVRLTGPVSRTSREETEAYFRARPYGAQIGALASRQSTPLASRDELDSRVAELQHQYPEGMVPVPDDWGGYRVAAEVIEFWQGRLNRLHDRLRYTRAAGGGWRIERLAP